MDGAPPEPVPDIGADEELTVEFPVESWEFSASFQRADAPCARTQTIELEPLSATTFALPAAGFADAYDVELFGRGNGGDVITQFRWTTTSDGPLPQPDAHMSVLANTDGELDSYGVELNITNLAESPDQADATITVTADNGQSVSFEAQPETVEAESCKAVDGQLFWQAPDNVGLQATELGEGPFTYTVELVLDGVPYVGTATWPDDVIPDFEPYTSLTFDPPLPAVTAPAT